MKSAALSFDALQEAVAKLPDGRLAASRRAALEHLRQHGLPTTRHEDWKYTDLTTIVDISNQSLERDVEQPRSQELDRKVDGIRAAIEADWLIIVNGLIDDPSLVALDKTGVNVTRLSESNDEVEFSAPLSDLNAALLHDGMRIRIDAISGQNRDRH